MLINDNVAGLVTSDVMEAEGITSAKNVVQERIENKRQKRVEWEASRQK